LYLTNIPQAGGGFSLAMHCDIRICSQSATFVASFLRIGLSGCEFGLSHLLPRAIGSTHAADLCLSGDFCNADKAFRIGLVSSVASDEKELWAMGLAKARNMLTVASPLGLQLTKKQLHAASDGASYEACVFHENVNQILCTNDAETKAFMAHQIQRFQKAAKL
jgi:enoyl-CoA hydratase